MVSENQFLIVNQNKLELYQVYQGTVKKQTELVCQQNISQLSVAYTCRKITLEKQCLSKNEKQEIIKVTKQKYITQYGVRIILLFKQKQGSFIKEYYLSSSQNNNKQSFLPQIIDNNLTLILGSNQIDQIWCSQENIFVKQKDKLLIYGTNNLCKKIEDIKQIWFPVNRGKTYYQLSAQNKNLNRFSQKTDINEIDILIQQIDQQDLLPPSAVKILLSDKEPLVDSTILILQNNQDQIVLLQVKEGLCDYRQLAVITDLDISQKQNQINQIYILENKFMIICQQQKIKLYILSNDNFNQQITEEKIPEIYCETEYGTDYLGCLLCDNKPIIINKQNKICLYKQDNILDYINQMQQQQRFAQAYTLINLVSEQKLKLALSKQLIAQQAIQCLYQNQFTLAFKLFKAAQISAIVPLFFFNLVDEGVGRQQLGLEQLNQGIPEEILRYKVPIFDNSQQALQILPQQQRESVLELLRAYIIESKTTIEQQSKEITQGSLQYMTLQILDTALLKSYIWSQQDSQQDNVQKILKQNLKISQQDAEQLLQQYPQQLLYYQIITKQYIQALNSINQQCQIPEQKAQQLCSFLQTIGLGDKGQVIPESLKQFHKENYVKIYQLDYKQLIQLFQQNTSEQQNVNPLSVLLCYESISSVEANLSKDIIGFYINLIEAGLHSKNYYENEYLKLQYILIDLYIKMLRFILDENKQQIRSANSYDQIWDIIDKLISIQYLQNVVKQDSDVEEIIFELENEIYCYPISQQIQKRSIVKQNVNQQTFPIKGELAILRMKITHLLESLTIPTTEQQYNYLKFLQLLQIQHCFLQDQAILCLKMYNFETGLSIISTWLGQYDYAEEICESVYQQSLQPDAKDRQLDVFLIYLQTLLKPTRIEGVETVDIPINYDYIPSMLERNYKRFDIIQTLQILNSQQLQQNISQHLNIQKLKQFIMQVFTNDNINVANLLFIKNVVNNDYKYLENKRENIRQTCNKCGEILKNDNGIVIEKNRVICFKCYQTENE